MSFVEQTWYHFGGKVHRVYNCPMNYTEINLLVIIYVIIFKEDHICMVAPI